MASFNNDNVTVCNQPNVTKINSIYSPTLTLPYPKHHQRPYQHQPNPTHPEPNTAKAPYDTPPSLPTSYTQTP